MILRNNIQNHPSFQRVRCGATWAVDLLGAGNGNRLLVTLVTRVVSCWHLVEGRMKHLLAEKSLIIQNDHILHCSPVSENPSQVSVGLENCCLPPARRCREQTFFLRDSYIEAFLSELNEQQYKIGLLKVSGRA